LNKVLFVCVHNSGRSKIAEACFNRYAKGGATTELAGLIVGNSVNPIVVTVAV
jgi:arsenate reductase